MMAKDNKLKVLVVSLILILVLITGFSFGYYLLNRFQESGNVAGSQCFKLELSNEKNAITLDNMYPISDEEGKKLTPYSFTITNTCDMLASYTVNMEMLEGTTLSSKYIDAMVNNEEIKLLTNYESTDIVISTSTESRILAKGTLAYNDSTDYTVRFWMDKDVEDAESMNKYFASKIVVVATPSTWNPKDAGYDTLHDAILANEYQSDPEDAVKKIEAKGTPDLTNTSPIIKWVEKIGESTTKEIAKPAESVIETYNKDTGTGDRTTQASNLTLNDTKMKLYTTKTFNSDTAKYTLSNPIYIDPTIIDYSEGTKYYFQSENIQYNQTSQKLATSTNSSNITIYQITGATKTIGKTVWNNVEYDSITYKLNVITLTETELETDKSDKGLYQGIDDYGPTYYYRGNVKNNNVYFANFYWQIVRINGDGSIRLMYNGSEKSATGVKQSINNRPYRFNNLFNSPTYVGYMYGDSNAKTFDEVHSNSNDSTIKMKLDEWYKTNIIDKSYNTYISNSAGFCGDRTLFSGDGASNDVKSYFGAYGRLGNNTAQFTCTNIVRDLYTTVDSNTGNKALTYPVGLITYDELAFAGMDRIHINKLSYTYSTSNYWTMSPSGFDNANAQECYQNADGFIAPWNYVANSFGLRPVINLKSDVKISGGIGTTNDPFVVE